MRYKEFELRSPFLIAMLVTLVAVIFLGATMDDIRAMIRNCEGLIP